MSWQRYSTIDEGYRMGEMLYHHYQIPEHDKSRKISTATLDQYVVRMK